MDKTNAFNILKMNQQTYIEQQKKERNNEDKININDKKLDSNRRFLF